MNATDQPRDPSADPGADIELAVNPEDVCQLIQLARDFHTQEAVILPDETPDQDLDMSGHAPGEAPANPLQEEFRTIIADLEPRQQFEVVALLRLGRGDFEVEEWESHFVEGAHAWAERTADHLLDQPLLADHLAAGLELLGHSCE